MSKEKELNNGKVVNNATTMLFKKYFATGIDENTFLYAQKERFIFL